MLKILNTKVIISFAVVIAAAALIIGGTMAFFSDTEASQGNILVAGTLDLKVDHTKQTYNDVDCNTCNLTLISDPSNMVVKKNGVDIDPYAASYVSWIHPAWTAQNDPDLLASNAKWIWEGASTKQEDTTQDVTYTFQKTFEWYGPILSSDLWFAIGSDNSIVVTLNGTVIATNPMEFGYQQEHMLHILAADVNDHIVQGTNVLTFDVKNWALANGNPETNPAGLIYKFYVSGNCQDNYYKSHCQLWGSKDLTGEKFFDFDDVKPGDHGTNVISLLPKDNDAWACLNIKNKQDDDNGLTEPESIVDSTAGAGEGELSPFLSTFMWWDMNQDGKFDLGETPIGSGNLGSINTLTLADSVNLPKLIGNATKYLGLAWCAGKWATAPVAGESFVCDGSEMGNIAQSDSFKADLEFYIEQVRSNPDFTCQAQLAR